MKHYIYCYLNPLKKGSFVYKNFTFDYEPFYIGKGYSDRIEFHLYEARKILEGVYKITGNKHKTHTILKILKNGLEPIRIKLYENLEEKESLELEKILIKEIGRNNLKLGPLTNLTDGGEGSCGYVCTKEVKLKISKTLKEGYKNGTIIPQDVRGLKNPFYGKTHTDKNKKIFSDTAKRTFIGTKQSEEHVEKKAAKIRGAGNGMYKISVLEKWVEWYGEDIAQEKYAEFLKNNRQGENNPQYGKLGQDHPTCKIMTLQLPSGQTLDFYGHEQVIKYLEDNNIIGDKFSYNSLRQYGSKNKFYKDYLLTTNKKK